jgi:hypothetical protein
MTAEQQAKLFEEFSQADAFDRAELRRDGGLALPSQARAHDGRRRDCGKRIRQGIGLHGAPTGRAGHTLTNLGADQLARFLGPARQSPRDALFLIYRGPEAREGPTAITSIQNNSDLAQGPFRLSGRWS